MALQETAFIEGHDYTFKQLRQMLAMVMLQPGVLKAGDMKVTAGAGMTVSVAAGDALVRMGYGTKNGMYWAYNDAAVVVAVAAADATKPRVDRVVLEVNDSNVTGVTDTPALKVLTGVATTGATLDNETGAQSTGLSQLSLATVLVPAASSSVSAGNIRDHRTWCRGANWSVLRQAASYTTANPSLTAIDATNLAPRIETSPESQMEVIVRGILGSNSLGAINFDVTAAGVTGSLLQREEDVATTTNNGRTLECAWELVPGGSTSMIILPRWSCSAGTATLSAVGVFGLQMIVREHIRQNAANT